MTTEMLERARQMTMNMIRHEASKICPQTTPKVLSMAEIKESVSKMSGLVKEIEDLDRTIERHEQPEFPTFNNRRNGL